MLRRIITWGDFQKHRAGQIERFQLLQQAGDVAGLGKEVIPTGSIGTAQVEHKIVGMAMHQ